MSENEKEHLIARFNELKTIDEKFDFWITELKRPYYSWASIVHSEIEPFIIHPKNPKDVEIINTKCIEQYIDIAERISPIKKIQIFDNLKEVFLEKYGYSKNQSKLIEVEKSIIERIKEENRQKRFPYLFQDKHFDKAFNDFYINNNTPDLSIKVYEMDELIVINNGYVLAQYSLWLDELLKKPHIAKRGELTHIQQMLILDYLGFGENMTSNYLKADLFAPLIRRDSKTTRQYFSKLNQEKNNRNLNIILEYFENAGLLDRVQLIKKDIDKINKKKL